MEQMTMMDEDGYVGEYEENYDETYDGEYDGEYPEDGYDEEVSEIEFVETEE